MTRDIFIERLREETKNCDKVELEKSIDFYQEAISDRMDEGMTETEAIDDLGMLNEIVEAVKESCGHKDNKITQYTEKAVDKIKTDQNTRVLLFVVLAILSASIWGSIAFTIVSIIFALYVCSISIIFGGLVTVITSIITMATTNIIAMLFYVGCGLVIVSIGIMILPYINRLTRFTIKSCKRLYEYLKTAIIGGEF